MDRWLARLLVLVMLVPAFGPLAAARTSPMGPHCQRRAAQPAMHCHHGMTMSAQPSSPDAAFSAFESCCFDHCCCRGRALLRWAKITPRRFEYASLNAEAAVPASGVRFVASFRFDHDSARAPPRA